MVVPIRQRLFGGELSQGQLLEQLVSRFEQLRCDGIFLPLVDHCGARLPVETLLNIARQTNRLHCSVVDASQAIAHVDTRSAASAADFLFGGGHKWLGSYLPLGIGFAGDEETAADLRKHMVESSCDDPLLKMLESSTSSSVKDPRETVNMTPLLTCRGALADVCWPNTAGQTANRKLTKHLLLRHGWKPLLPQAAFQSGIVLAQADCSSARRMNPVTVRRKFRDAGLSVTTYAGGYIRCSLPFQPFTSSDEDVLVRGLTAMSSNTSIIRRVSRLGGAFVAPTSESVPDRPPCVVD